GLRQRDDLRQHRPPSAVRLRFEVRRRRQFAALGRFKHGGALATRRALRALLAGGLTTGGGFLRCGFRHVHLLRLAPETTPGCRRDKLDYKTGASRKSVAKFGAGSALQWPANRGTVPIRL